MDFEKNCFLKNYNENLRNADPISVNLELSISIERPRLLSIELQFTLYTDFI